MSALSSPSAAGLTADGEDLSTFFEVRMQWGDGVARVFVEFRVAKDVAEHPSVILRWVSSICSAGEASSPVRDVS